MLCTNGVRENSTTARVINTFSTKFPAIVAHSTGDKSSHGLIRGARLQLVVRALAVLALAAQELVRGRLHLSDRGGLHVPLLGVPPPLLLFLAGHLCGGHAANFIYGYRPI